MTRFKIVPDAEPNADGEWIECPVDVSAHTRWRHMESIVKPHIPAGYHLVAVEPGSRNAEPVKHEVLAFPK